MSKKIILIGYMGTGKSSIGENLAKNLKIPFIDLDSHIEHKEKLTIPEIFKIKGTLYFRKKEKAILNELLNSKNNFVLATGGGTPCYYDNMEQINKHGISILINTPLPNLVARLAKNKASRPLISHLTDADLSEYIAKHLFERNPFYYKAKIQISNTTSIIETTKNIIAALKNATFFEV